MPTIVNRLSLLIAMPKFTYRGGACRLAWLALTLAMFVSTPCQAQVATDALVQLGMLDTPIDDLVRLGTSYADALRDLKAARLSIQTVQTLRPSAVTMTSSRRPVTTRQPVSSR